jgi:ABC-2 type transport system ATP-binding protein
LALKTVDLEIRKGEIFALLGPNGAGKTTLISIVCGIVTPSTGTVSVDGRDIIRDYRFARARSGWCRRRSPPTRSRRSGRR